MVVSESSFGAYVCHSLLRGSMATTGSCVYKKGGWGVFPENSALALTKV